MELALRRATLGLAILAAHAGLIFLIARSRLSEATEAPPPPVVATFLQQTTVRPDAPALRDPQMSPIYTVQIEPPEIDVPTEPMTAAITVAVTERALPASATMQHPSEGVGVPAMSHIDYLQQPSPRYPAESRRAREEGLVILRVLVDERGYVKTIDVYRSSGHPRLDEAARNAVARALFKPYIDGGIAHAASAMIPIEFSLRRTSS